MGGAAPRTRAMPVFMTPLTCAPVLPNGPASLLPAASKPAQKRRHNQSSCDGVDCDIRGPRGRHILNDRLALDRVLLRTAGKGHVGRRDPIRPIVFKLRQPPL